jgi:anthranilate synthase/aminodeoxychorismate synthase-like glutamine amidotransferase
VTVLVVDHYDSFVYNLVQLVESLGSRTAVVRSDAQPVAELLALRPDAVILSPGPGRPEDAGCFVELLGALPDDTPVLGVCLGHQALGAAFGGTIDRVPEPVHGKTSAIRHDGTGLFDGVPDPFDAGRYHSLVLMRDAVPPDLEVIATTDDGLVMAVRHRALPRVGVQFHPESILTPSGPRIVENFLAMTLRR